MSLIVRFNVEEEVESFAQVFQPLIGHNDDGSIFNIYSEFIRIERRR